NGVFAPPEGRVDNSTKLCGSIEGGRQVKRVLAEQLLHAPPHDLGRVAVHHAHGNAVATHAGGLTDDAYRVAIVFKRGDEGQCIEGMILERHVVRVGHHQVALEEVHGLRQHERRDIATGSFDTDFFPPPCKPCGTTTKFEQCFYAFVFRYQLFHHLFLPDFGTFIAAFIPLFVCVGVFPVEEPFGSVLPVLLRLGDKFECCFFLFHRICLCVRQPL